MIFNGFSISGVLSIRAPTLTVITRTEARVRISLCPSRAHHQARDSKTAYGTIWRGKRRQGSNYPLVTEVWEKGCTVEIVLDNLTSI